MRLLLVGAFPYPHHQGSQVYFQEQAIALRAAGVEVELLTYAGASDAIPGDLNRWRAVDGFLHKKTPPWSAPRSLRAGPSWRKPLADMGLALTLNDAIASKDRPESRYDAILTHNAEAAFVATLPRLKRAQPMPPVIYCVHTLMENELSSYPKYLKEMAYLNSDSGITHALPGHKRNLKRVIDRAGGILDRSLARRVNGWIVLTQSANCVMKNHSTAPGQLILPPVPDPRHSLETIHPVEVANRHGLVHKSFYLYSGNLDGYQEIQLLIAAAEQHRQDATPIVIASHDPRVLEPGRFGHSGIKARLVESGSQMLALIASARATLVMRKAEGGFPIKLANSLAAGTPAITFLEREWGLTHAENAWVIQRDHSVSALGEAMERLADPGMAEKLGAGARALYEAGHQPEKVAERTLSLIDQVRSTRV